MTCKMEQKQKIPSDYYLTYDQMNIIYAFLKMWLKIDSWMKIYIYIIVYNIRDSKAITNHLNNLPSQFYDMISMFYGTETGENLKNLIFNLIKSEMEVVEVMKYGDKVLTKSRIIRWYQTADKLSSNLARINIYWDENQWKYLLYQYIKLKIDEINAIINDDFEAEKEAFDNISDIIFIIASYTARGVISSNLQLTPNQ